jgi:hypothetical protein
MAENREDEIVAFDMTRRDIAETAEALSKHLDNNHPKKSGSYSDFFDVVKTGHKALLAQENYGKIN